jgi:hypothetical protein
MSVCLSLPPQGVTPDVDEALTQAAIVDGSSDSTLRAAELVRALGDLEKLLEDEPELVEGHAAMATCCYLCAREYRSVRVRTRRGELDQAAMRGDAQRYSLRKFVMHFNRKMWKFSLVVLFATSVAR